MADFLCGVCSSLMCEDCQSMADEYVTLYKIHRQSALMAQDELKIAQDALRRAERDRDMYKAIAMQPMPDVLQAWLNSMRLETAVKSIEAAQADAKLLKQFDDAMSLRNYARATDIIKRIVKK